MMVPRSKSLTCIAALIVAAALAPGSVAADRRGESDRHRDRDRDGRRGSPNIVVEPYIDLSRRQKPNLDAPEFIMAELETCIAGGVRLFVDCLRPNHSSVMIRRLEACLRSETIPDEPARVRACLPPARLR